MRRPLLVFFALTYALAWICWATSVSLTSSRSADGALIASVAEAIFLVGVFAPGLVALALTARAEGRRGTRALLCGIVKWDVGIRWYVFAIAYMPTVKLLAALVHRVIIGEWPRFGTESLLLMLAALLVSTWVQAGEEVGWRAYALPALSARVGLAGASVILGIIWATWHLPLFFFASGDTLGQSFPLYLLQVTAVSVTMAWLYWRTGGSLLLVMLMHAAINNLKDIVPSAQPGAANPLSLHGSVVGWITVALLWTAATYFLFQMRGTSLALETAKQETAHRD